MAIEFNATQIPGLLSNTKVSDKDPLIVTEWRAIYAEKLIDVTSITLSESFKKPVCIYLFALKVPVLDGNFIPRVKKLLSNYDYIDGVDRCFLWLDDEGNFEINPIYKFGQAIIIDGEKQIKKVANGQSQKLWINRSIYFAPALLSTVSINEDQDGFEIRRDLLSVDSYDYGLYLVDPSTTKDSWPLGKIATNRKKLSLEPPLLISYHTAGSSIQFDISLPFNFENPKLFYIGEDAYPYHDDINNATILSSGVKYYFKREGNSVEITYPTFRSVDPLKFRGFFHPAAIFNPEYTKFAFEPAKVLATNIPTTYGKFISVETIAESALVFAKSPDANDGQSRYYWTPEGEFALLNTAEEPLQYESQNRLLCGLSGTEAISFKGKSETNQGDLICFKSGQPAVANVFPLDANNQSKAAALLNSTFTTAWISFKKNAGNDNSNISYYSQPADAALFKPQVIEDKNKETANILTYSETPSSNLTDHDQSFFPLATSAIAMPVLGKRVKGGPGYYDQTDISQFEIQILNPSRKTEIAKAKRAFKKLQGKKLKTALTTDLNLSTTPQGLMVNLATDFGWQSLTMANPTTVDKLPLQFNDITEKGDHTALQEAFQTNEQFLVISNPIPVANIEYYKQYFQNKIDIAAWPFILDITGQNNWTSKTGFNNIVIFKFCNYSIEERIKNQQLWTDPLNFNTTANLSGLSDWIIAYIETAKKSVADQGNNSPFKHFVDIVTNENWNGILCLQVTLELNSVPKEIKAILAGIDTSRFTAHHFGIEANQISLTADNKINPDFKSSMFGLINYIDEVYEKRKPSDPLIQAKGDFDFKVLELQVLFEQSEVKDFKSKIQLTLNKLFNETVSIKHDVRDEAITENSIVLNGLYDKRNGNTSYAFAITKVDQLNLASIALDNLKISGVQLTTVGETDGIALTTRFYISGKLAFNQLENFDLFSYEKLGFSNLILDMKFNLGDLGPDKTPKKTFSFDPTTLIFVKTDVQTREDSLVPNFPLDLTGLIYNTPNLATKEKPAVTPASLSYIPVDAPLATMPILATDTWYALRFNVNLGSLGALTAKVGFNAEIILAWSPGVTNNKTQVFIKMPFSGGKPDKGFSLQGILKFAVGDIMFLSTPAEDKEKIQYAMVFTQIGLSLLGLKLPKTGNTIFYLFGNPEGNQGDASTGNLAWFGAYQAKKEEKGKNLLNNHKSLTLKN